MIYLQRKNLSHYGALMRIDRPIGTYLLAWPALWALWLAAGGVPHLHLLLAFFAGVFLMRSAGCVINDYADRDFDGRVERTQDRPLARGAVTSAEALQLFALLVVCATLLLLCTNWLTAQLALVAIALATIYPFTKRVTHLPQFVLGAAFSWAVPMAFAAQQGTIPTNTWWLYAAVVIWVVSYDTFYAMVDRDDDLRIGIKSMAILFGRFDQLVIALLQALFIGLMLNFGRLEQLPSQFYLGLFAAAVLFVYQHRLAIRRGRDGCFTAFLNNNYVGLVVFIGLATSFI